MIFDIHVEPYEITEQRNYSIDFPEGRFTVLQIDKGSYISKAQIETSLNFHVEDGCYNLQIGKYCAIAEDVLFMMDLMHDYKYISMGAIEEFRNMPRISEDIDRYRVQRKGQILIENDVWIGHGATIMGGVTVHNGAVIGAQAVVTKDVPPYAIVAGNPARIIKYRFDENQINALLNIAWWHWNSEELKSRYQLMQLPVSEFITHFEIKKDKNFHNIINKNVDGLVYACIADMECEFPVFPKILKEFCHRYHSMDAQLVIYIPDTGSKEKNMNAVMEALIPYEEVNCSVQIIDDNEVCLESIIYYSDCYITNRCFLDLAAVEYAYSYSKKVLSGVDIPIWKTL